MRARTKVLIVAGVLATASMGVLATHASADGPMGRHDGPGGHGPMMGGPMMGGPGPIGMMLFEEMQKNGGKLTKEQADAAIQAAFAKYDTNHDGKLSLDEYQAFWTDMMHERMVRSFQFLDRSGDAEITEQEFQQPADWMMQRFDRNGDGTISKDDMRPPFGSGRPRSQGPARRSWRSWRSAGPGGPGGPDNDD